MCVPVSADPDNDKIANPPHRRRNIHLRSRDAVVLRRRKMLSSKKHLIGQCKLWDLYAGSMVFYRIQSRHGQLSHLLMGILVIFVLLVRLESQQMLADHSTPSEPHFASLKKPRGRLTSSTSAAQNSRKMSVKTLAAMSKTVLPI